MNEELKQILVDLGTWWDSETDTFQDLVSRLVASLPGGEELADAIGLEAPLIGWKEAELLGRLLVAVQEASDVKAVANVILSGAWPER